jgi:tryptophan synthase alpha chain
MYLTEDNRIIKKFSDLRSRGESALICYVVGGYPSFSATEKIISALVLGGADMIEVGIPFSDPIADGPSIQKASFEALSKGVTAYKCFQLSRKIRSKFSDLPILVMTYSNIPFKHGFKEFLCKSKIAGIDGLILPDMGIEESGVYVKHSIDLDMATVFLASPNTSNSRIRKIIKYSSGFIYVVSVLGTTGARKSIDRYSITAIKKIRRIASKNTNIAVGFGISQPYHAGLVIQAGANAVIIGSALIDKIRQAKSILDMQNSLKLFATSMKKGCAEHSHETSN